MADNEKLYNYKNYFPKSKSLNNLFIVILITLMSFNSYALLFYIFLHSIHPWDCYLRQSYCDNSVNISDCRADVVNGSILHPCWLAGTFQSADGWGE